MSIPAAVVDVVSPPLPPPEPAPTIGLMFTGQTLTVEGTSQRPVEPEVAYVHVSLSGRNGAPGTEPVQLLDAAPVINALVTAGIPAASIQQALRDDPYMVGGQIRRPGRVDIRFQVAHPSVQELWHLGKLVYDAAGTRYRADSDAAYARAECNDAYAAVSRTALQNARRVAEARALSTGKRIGPIVGIEEEQFTARQGACDLRSSVTSEQSIDLAVEPADAGKIIVIGSLRVTFQEF